MSFHPRLSVLVLAAIALAAGLFCFAHLPQPIPDRLIVTRTHNDVNNPSAPALDNTVTDQAVVRKLYTDVVGLPQNKRPSNGPVNCLPDTEISYDLAFYMGKTLLLQAVDHPTGCSAIVLSPGGSRIDSSFVFDNELEQALGLSESDFYGNL